MRREPIPAARVVHLPPGGARAIFPVRRTLDNGTRVTVRDGPLPAEGYDWYEVHVAGDQLASGCIVAHALRR